MCVRVCAACVCVFSKGEFFQLYSDGLEISALTGAKQRLTGGCFITPRQVGIIFSQQLRGNCRAVVSCNIMRYNNNKKKHNWPFFILRPNDFQERANKFVLKDPLS